jgi:uncharacterized membrane protein
MLGVIRVSAAQIRQLIKDQKLQITMIVFLGIFLRLPGLGSRPLWYDEAFSVLFSRTGLSGILYGTLAIVEGAAADIHPPLYYGLLNVWMDAFGQSVVSIRSLSLLLGIGVILLAWRVNTDLFGPTSGLVGAFLVAIAPFQIHYAQEARMYMLMNLILLGATLSMIRGLRNPTWWIWGLYGLLCAVGMYTHVIAAAYILPLSLIPLFTKKRWKVLPYLAASILIALVLYLPWLIRLPSMISKVEQAYWIPKPGVTALLQVLISFVTDLPIPGMWLTGALFLTLLITALAGYRTIAAIRGNLEHSSNGVWLAYLSFTPILMGFLVSQWRPVLIPRVVITSGTIFLLWIAWALTATEMPRIVSLFAGVLLVVGMFMGWIAHYQYDGFPYAPFQQMNRSLQAELEPDGIILHSNKLTMLPSHYYDPGLPHTYMADTPGSASDTLALPTQEVIGLFAEDDIQAAVGNSNRVLFVIFAREIDEYRELGYNKHPYLGWLQDNFHQRQTQTWGDLAVYAFEK